MPLECSHCRAEAVVFELPDELAEYGPAEQSRGTICRVCLTVDPLESSDLPEHDTDLTLVSEAMPEDVEHAAAIAAIIGHFESLALNRWNIDALVTWLEQEGVDVFLVLDRLAADGSLRPAIDLQRRSHQLQQLLE